MVSLTRSRPALRTVIWLYLVVTLLITSCVHGQAHDNKNSSPDGDDPNHRHEVRSPIVSSRDRDCVVNRSRLPSFNCPRACSSIPLAQATAGASLILSLPFPITLVTPSGRGSVCPTATTSCICPTEDCVTGEPASTTTIGGPLPDCKDLSVPTRTTYASAVTTFSVKTPARFGGKCTSTDQRPLTQSCPCTTLAPIATDCASCTFTATRSTVSSRVVGFGTQLCPQPTRTGCPPAASTTLQCSSTLPVTDCIQEPTPVCPAYACLPNQTSVPASFTVECTFLTITPAANGGSSCTRDPVKSTLPVYQEKGCECSNFSSTTSVVNAKTTTFTSFGQALCTSQLSPKATAASCNAITTITGEACSTTRVTVSSEGHVPTHGVDENGWHHQNTDPKIPCSGGSKYTGGSDPVRCVASWLQERFSNINGLFYGDVDFTGKVGGRLAVARNATLDVFSVGSELPNANKPCVSGTADNFVLTVGGVPAINTGRVFGGIVINRALGASQINSRIHLNPNCFITEFDANLVEATFEANRQYVIGLSKHLLALVPTLTIQWDDGLWAWKVVRIRASVTGTFDVLTFPTGVTKVNIGNWNEVVSSIIGPRSLIINLPGVAIEGMDYEALKPIADRVIWNWGPYKTSVTIKWVSLYGSILAPAASITGSGSLSGQVVADTISGLSLHIAAFQGCVSLPGSGVDGGLPGPSPTW